MGRRNLNWRQLKHNQLMSTQGPQFSPHMTDKAQISGTMASIGISDIVTASVNSEKTHIKKCMMIMINIIIIMNESQETTVCGGCQKSTSAMKQRHEK